MNVTIFPTGKGGSESAVRYLLSDTDHQGKKRSVMPEILFGDPSTFTEIANATSRLHKYTSGVIAFRDHESITPEQITTLIETFRSTFLPGLKADENFADCWVMHRDKSNVELHFLVANTELSSGQQLNIHPPGQKNIEFFNAFVAVMNDNFGFPQVVPDPLKIALKPFEAKSENGKKDKKAKNDFAKVLHSEIVNGFIKNRNQLIGYLKKSKVDIALIGDDFITVRLPGAKKNTRLKGPLFSKESDYAELVKQHHQSKTPKFLTPAEAQDQKAKLVAGIEARAAFNQRRYFGPRPGAKRDRAALKGSPTAVTTLAKETARQEPLPNAAARTLSKQLGKLKEQLAPAKPGASLPHHQARFQDQKERDGALATVMGSVALGGLEAQIGNLSMQYHTLKLMLVNATGRRAEQIKAQLYAVEQRLAALNLELEKKKLQVGDPSKPVIT